VAREVGGIVLPVLFLGPDSCKIIEGKEFYGKRIMEIMPTW
jgi:hypothetical protein